MKNIDTSTTAGKIAVMQASDNGRITEARSRTKIDTWGKLILPIFWNWEEFNYRIRPQAVEDAACDWVESPQPRSWIGKDMGFKLSETFIAGAKWREENEPS